MIDNGFCFNAGEWNFPDAPLRGIYARHRVYGGHATRVLRSFEPWLARLEERIDEAAMEEAASEIPPRWYDDDADALQRLLEQLLEAAAAGAPAGHLGLEVSARSLFPTGSEPMPESFRFRILRYTPNLIRDEWVNIGVFLENGDGTRQSIRVIEESAEIARVRRLHPNADEEILRQLPSDFNAMLRAPRVEWREL